VLRGYWKQNYWPLSGKRILETEVLATQWLEDTGKRSHGNSVVRGYWKLKSWPLSGKRILETEVMATQWLEDTGN
jgi:hypothetical protein